MNSVPCDYVTGYLVALGVLAALRRRACGGGSWEVRVSLAQTGRWLRDFSAPRAVPATVDLSVPPGYFVESDIPIGRLRNLGFAVQISAAPTHWALPTNSIGQHPPALVGEPVQTTNVLPLTS